MRNESGINFSLRGLKFLYISSTNFQIHERQASQHLMNDYWTSTSPSLTFLRISPEGQGRGGMVCC